MYIFRLLMFSSMFFLASCTDSENDPEKNGKFFIKKEKKEEKESKEEKIKEIDVENSTNNEKEKKIQEENNKKIDVEKNDSVYGKQETINKAIKHDISCLLNNKKNNNEPDELLAIKKRAEGKYSELFDGGDIILGNKNAAVQIAIIFDPLDSDFSEFWKEVILKFNDSKNVCFRLFIISSISDNEIKNSFPVSLEAAKSCLIVNIISPEKFSDFYEKISYERVDHLLDEYVEVAKNIGISEERFRKMSESNNITEKIASNGILTGEIVYGEELPLIFMNAPEKRIKILPPLDLEKMEKVISIMNDIILNEKNIKSQNNVNEEKTSEDKEELNKENNDDVVKNEEKTSEENKELNKENNDDVVKNEEKTSEDKEELNKENNNDVVKNEEKTSEDKEELNKENNNDVVKNEEKTSEDKEELNKENNDESNEKKKKVKITIEDETNNENEFIDNNQNDRIKEIQIN